VGVGFLRSPTDLGIADAMREALARAKGKYVVLLNDDTVVPGKLVQLVALTNLSAQVRLVEPMSDVAAPPPMKERPVPHPVAALQKAELVVSKLEGLRLGKAAEVVRGGVAEALPYMSFPREHWTRIRTNNPLKRLNREIRRRTRVVWALSRTGSRPWC
jgi:hypothetical protein